MSALSPTHASYLDQLGIGAPPKTRRRKPSSAGHSKRTIGVFKETDLSRLRGLIFWRFHTDETRDGRTILVQRGLSTVARIECATDALAWDAERICAGTLMMKWLFSSPLNCHPSLRC